MEQKKKNIPPPPLPKGNGFKPSFYWLYAVIAIAFMGYYFWAPDIIQKEISYKQFEQYVKNETVSKIIVITNKNTVKAEVVQDSVKTIFGEKATNSKTPPILIIKVSSAEELSKDLRDLEYKGDLKYEESRDFWDAFWSFFPILFFIGLWLFFMRRMNGGAAAGAMGGIFNVGRSKAQLFDKDNISTKTTFKDVAGLSEAKQEIEEIVSFLKNPSKYTELGGKIPKGALLVGPPGTGKTLLAKAVAGEANVPFFTLSGSDFVEMFVGVGASRVRDLFRQAKAKSPCIIFIDEIDAVGRARSRSAIQANDERESTLNQLLTEMDGFGSNSGVIILAATNRADVLDKALLRAGRFDRQIQVELPDVQERKDIFNVHLRPLKLETNLDIEFLAKQTPGFSGADIANVCNEAALIAARKDKIQVEKQDFLDAVDRIIGGLEKKNKIITAAEKKAIAFHEAGHATISWKLEHAAPLVKVTIVPRGEALGAAWYLPEERVLTTREHMLDEMCSTMGGRAAEELFFNDASTGALNDLERVTKRAYAMVSYFGMSKKLANMSFYDSTGQSEYGFTKPYSEKTAELIDAEVKKIVEAQYERAKKILIENQKEHHELAELLMEREVMFTEDLEQIFGKRPWVSRSEELLNANGKK